MVRAVARRGELSPGLPSALRAELGSDRVVDEVPLLAALSAGPYGAEGDLPAAAVWPRSSDEAARLMRVAYEHRVPVVPRGAGTRWVRGAEAVSGAMLVFTTAMRRILGIDWEASIVRVEAGVTAAEIDRLAAPQGLRSPIVPRGPSTVGGAVASGAPLPYGDGSLDRYVLGSTTVFADAEVVDSPLGRLGYDLRGLGLGAEGTLGLHTELTLRLLPRRPVRRWRTFHRDIATAVTELLAWRDRPVQDALLFDRVEGGLFVEVVADEDVVGAPPEAEPSSLGEPWSPLRAAAFGPGWWPGPSIQVPPSRLAPVLERVLAIAAAQKLELVRIADPTGGIDSWFRPGPGLRVDLDRAVLELALAEGGGPRGGVGRRYPWALPAEPKDRWAAMRAAVDPEGRMNPGCRRAE